MLAGESAESLDPAGSYPWTGFETKMHLSSTDTVFEVRALGAHGECWPARGRRTAN